MDYYDALDFLWTQGQGGAAASSGERICAGIYGVKNTIMSLDYWQAEEVLCSFDL